MADENKPNLYDRLLAGDATAVPEFREFLRRHPDLVETYSRKPTEILLARIANITGVPQLYIAMLTAKIETLRTELAGPQPSPIERLLVERVVTTWLQVFEADLQPQLRSETTFELGRYDMQRQNSGHRRLLSAIKTLATVRRLALPIKVDVNVAGTIKTENTPAAMVDRFKASAN